jgi:dCMP deaminase
VSFELEYQRDGRPSWDLYFVQIAEAVSLRGDCRRSQVGAVLVMADNHTIFIGYNGTEPGQPGCLEGKCPRGLKSLHDTPAYSPYTDCIGIHAEKNALMSCVRNNGNTIGSRIYIIRRPCDDCIGMMKTYGVAKAFWSEGYLDLTPPKMG